VHEVRGVLHDGRSSKGIPAVLRVYADGTARIARGDAGEISLPVTALSVPDRLGGTPRRIALPDGGVFETADNAAVDAMLDAHGRRGHDWLHRLESRWSTVIPAAVLVLAAGAALVVFGLPALARHGAFAVSPELAAKVGRGALDVLDQSLRESALDEARRDGLRQRFSEVAAGAPAGYDFELLFRAGGALGANAFALPSGTVVMTDELVALAAHDDELVAVLAHEVGHVVERHGLRSAIQSSLLALAIVLVTGDLSSTSGFVASLPTLLAESHYSRDFEREADDHALAYLRANDIDPGRFAELLVRLERAEGDAPAIPFLSSHPATRERIERLRSGGGGDR
jgi:Zn-dependent protease with chaperone function